MDVELLLLILAFIAPIETIIIMLYLIHNIGVARKKHVAIIGVIITAVSFCPLIYLGVTDLFSLLTFITLLSWLSVLEWGIIVVPTIFVPIIFALKVINRKITRSFWYIFACLQMIAILMFIIFLTVFKA